MRAIERYGWKEIYNNEEWITFGKSVYKISIFKDGAIHIGLSNLKYCDFTFEELLAVYKTAKEIKNEKSKAKNQ